MKPITSQRLKRIQRIVVVNIRHVLPPGRLLVKLANAG